jgi:hypothetical protein
LKVVLDTGALLALARNDRAMWRRLKAALARDLDVVSHGGVLGQAWRGRGPREPLLARALRAVEVRPLDEGLGRRAGELLASSRTRDVIDAAIVVLAEDGDHVLTSDPADLAVLAEAHGAHLEIIQV